MWKINTEKKPFKHLLWKIYYYTDSTIKLTQVFVAFDDHLHAWNVFNTKLFLTIVLSFLLCDDASDACLVWCFIFQFHQFSFPIIDINKKRKKKRENAMRLANCASCMALLRQTTTLVIILCQYDIVKGECCTIKISCDRVLEVWVSWLKSGMKFNQMPGNTCKIRYANGFSYGRLIAAGKLHMSKKCGIHSPLGH